MSPYIPHYHDLPITFTPTSSSTPSKATVHYISAGSPHHPTLLLLHGFPASSHQYRDFIPLLADSYHVLAPDYPGFGHTQLEQEEDFDWTFANLTLVMAAWLKALGVKEAALFIQDFGAPVGLRLATSDALKVTAVISQNGNAYDEGLGDATFGPLKQWWASSAGRDDEEIRRQIAGKMLTPEGTKHHIVKGTPERDLELVDPVTWTLAYHQNIAGEANAKSKLDLIFDYRTNVELYPAFQKWIRESQVPVLAVWGRNDTSFIPPGAEAFRKDCPGAVVHLLDAGHFALESVRWEVARMSRQFLTANGI